MKSGSFQSALQLLLLLEINNDDRCHKSEEGRKCKETSTKKPLHLLPMPPANTDPTLSLRPTKAKEMAENSSETEDFFKNNMGKRKL
jgi:hypothetical protein